MKSPNIYSWVKAEENKFLTDEIQIGDNWYWNFRTHVQMIFHLMNGKFFTGENNWLRAFKNIMQPIINLSSWTEDIDLKDVTFFIDSHNGKALSFLIKKYHDEVYVKEHDLDKLFDDITESDISFGGVLVQKSKDCPEVLHLASIAFCNQTDVLGGCLAIKHDFSSDELTSMSKLGWGNENNGATISIEDLIILANENEDGNNKKIEVYIVKGSMPEHYLLDNDNMESYSNQVQIIAFYVDKEGNKQGVTLYRKEESDNTLKFFSSKKVYKRGLGNSVGEDLLPPQIWTNFLTIHKTNLIESASKIPLQTTDPNFTNRNEIQDMENLQVTIVEEGKSINQIPTAAPANINILQGAISEWFEHAQLTGSAYDPILGKEASSGTTFRGQERSVAQNRGIHDKRRGQRAKFIEELYRDWIIPDIKKEITKGKKFLASLTNEELNWVAEQMATVEATRIIIDTILKEGKYVTKEEQDALIKIRKESILKKGNKQLIEILGDEFEDIEIKIGINIAGKQKDLVNLSDKLLSIFQFIFANPQGFQSAMQIPALAKSFENILEYGGLSIGDFSSLLTNSVTQTPAIQNGQQTESPQLTLNGTQQ